MPGKINNRRNVRVFCGAPARVEGPRGPIRGTCRNISVGGLFFVGGTLPVGKSAELSIQLPALGVVQAVGEVRYHHDYPEGPGMGIKFSRITQDHLALVNRWVEAHQHEPA